MGERRLFSQGRSGERPVLITPVNLKPRQKIVLKTTMKTGPNQRRGAVVTTTPGVRTFDQDVRFESACP